jgi:hypothetical protein
MLYELCASTTSVLWSPVVIRASRASKEPSPRRRVIAIERQRHGGQRADSGHRSVKRAGNVLV